MSISSIRIETAHASEPIEQRATDEPKATVTDAGSAKSARSIRYTMTVLNTKSNTEAVFLETVMEDGRYRSESKSKNAGNSVESISDKTGSSITILTSSKTVYSPAHRVGGPNPTWQNFQGLKHERKLSEQNLETKDLDGKRVSGFVMKQFERTYTVWTDVSTDELVQVEYDAPRDQHVTMNQFQIDELVADALFDCRIPDGHRVNPQREHLVSRSSLLPQCATYSLERQRTLGLFICRWNGPGRPTRDESKLRRMGLGFGFWGSSKSI